MKISLIAPTRARPDRLVAMVESALARADRPDRVHAFVGVDADDVCRGSYAAMLPRNSSLIVQEQRVSVPALMNILATEHATGDIVMACSDDIVFCSMGWDTALEQAFAAVPDRMLVAYTNDGRNRDKCEHFAVSREWIKAVGYFMWADLEHFSADTWVEDIGRRLQRCQYLPTVVTEHRHFKYGKSPFDATYAHKRQQPQRGPSMSDRDLQRYHAGAAERERAADRVRAAMRVATQVAA